ncbi:rRNA maturation RNase YbeY [candidate division WWE3 bacterium RIFOXYC1_FULL_39_7]|uniref:Endoribonuclease YbeY n=2 Tax=Katanobacteria TaxID=422282 RepID=A0A1F4X7J4_UNCKA|nr:MAG: rRNA maturation RNase YbeY [candidate division WWE3 bacterium RIFOXYC1_FULL_39_7]OGC77599.1 MAG: rRNA maturation RNase YbeY [candidate division WWE3 bacterium RIFOXYD1_FULL_39_9]
MKTNLTRGNIEISITLTNDSEIRKLNKKFLNKDYATDVLSFNIDQELEHGKYYLGDVIVNVEQAERQAGEYGNTLEQEIAALVEHGVLHLLGVHHDGDDH